MPDTKSPFIVEQFITKHKIQVSKEGPWKEGGYRWELEICLLDPSHTDRSACITRSASGKIGYKCHHASCNGKGWREARQKLEPGYHDKGFTDDFDLQEAHSGIQLEPLPLKRPLDPPTEFPVEALGATLSEATKAIHETIQAPLPMCASSILAAASLCVQAHIDIIVDGRIIPSSLFLVTIGDSGERKTSVDKVALAPHREYQHKLAKDYEKAFTSYKLEVEAYNKGKAEAKKVESDQDKDTIVQDIQKRLEKLPQAPQEPLHYLLIAQEPSLEALQKSYANGYPSKGLYTSEGGRLLTGYGMGKDHRTKTAAGFCEFWDGGVIDRVRVEDGILILVGKRLALHIMLQGAIAESELLGDPLMEEQGFLSRVLLSCPDSTVGTRLYKAHSLELDERYTNYSSRVLEHYSKPLPLEPDSKNILKPRQVKLNDEAKALYIQYHDKNEQEIGKGGSLEIIRAFGNKCPEHALRVAAVLACFEDINVKEITGPLLASAIQIVEYYTSEIRRLRKAGYCDPQIKIAENLLSFLHKWREKKGELIALPDVCQYGPLKIRGKDDAIKFMKILEQYYWIIPIEGETEVNGVRRRNVWKIREN